MEQEELKHKENNLMITIAKMILKVSYQIIVVIRMISEVKEVVQENVNKYFVF